MSNFISLATAIEMTTRYRSERNSILKTEYQNQNVLCICETFEKSSFQQLMNLPGCAGIRIYYGMNADKTIHAIIVGVNAENEDILPSSAADSTASVTEEDTIVENGSRCPDLCPADSPLNS